MGAYRLENKAKLLGLDGKRQRHLSLLSGAYGSRTIHTSHGIVGMKSVASITKEPIQENGRHADLPTASRILASVWSLQADTSDHILCEAGALSDIATHHGDGAMPGQAYRGRLTAAGARRRGW